MHKLLKLNIPGHEDYGVFIEIDRFGNAAILPRYFNQSNENWNVSYQVPNIRIYRKHGFLSLKKYTDDEFAQKINEAVQKIKAATIKLTSFAKVLDKHIKP